MQHVDVLIAGAGISGVGSAYHLKTQCPEKSFVVLEGLESFGGTWLMHRYPGIRSDSDLYTFGYRFKPWTGVPIAPAEDILQYMGEVIDENGLDEHIRYQHWIESADFSDESQLWTIRGVRKDTNEKFVFTTGFLWMCQGYYEHSEGYTPDWPGMDKYQGQIIHPQTWPEDLDYKDKNVLVIGSGATTATVVPAIAGDTKHTTVLQRSPTYFIPNHNANETADRLRAEGVPEQEIHDTVRQELLQGGFEFTKRAKEESDQVKEELLAGVKAYLSDEEVEKNFTPRYRPWQQRIAMVPEGDLFKGMQAGKASVVTDEIECFNETGILTRGGKQLDADIIVTATGFNLKVLGGINFSRNDEAIDIADTVTYRGMMFTGVPNMLWVFGYFRASWTLRVDLLGDFVCRLLKHMDEKGLGTIEPVLAPDENKMERLAWMDSDNFNPGYLMRSQHKMPKRLDKHEWQHTQEYWLEKDEIPAIKLDGAEFRYARRN